MEMKLTVAENGTVLLNGTGVPGWLKVDVSNVGAKAPFEVTFQLRADDLEPENIPGVDGSENELLAQIYVLVMRAAHFEKNYLQACEDFCNVIDAQEQAMHALSKMYDFDFKGSSSLPELKELIREKSEIGF